MHAFRQTPPLLSVLFFLEINWALKSDFVDPVISVAIMANLVLNWNGNENESVCDAKKNIFRMLQLKLNIHRFNECTKMIQMRLEPRISVGLHWEIDYHYSSWWQLEYHAFVCCCDFKCLFWLINYEFCT